MSTPRYRIGNDLTVLWAINNKDGSPYDLSQKEVRLFVTHPRDRIEVEATIQTLQGGVINNVIRWDFSGLDQRVLGKYRLTAEIYTSSNKKLIRKDITEAFELVSRSEMENDEGGEEIMDGGDLYLSSTLDIYRFGIPKVKIGTDGFWYIDNVKTTVSALGGGPGLVKNIYTENDFDKTFDDNSVIDTFNAHAVASLEKRIKFLEGDFYTQVRNLTDVLFSGDPQAGQALVWDGTYWTAKDVATKGESGGGLSDEELKIFKDLQKLLGWFSLDEDNNMIKAHYGLYSYGALVAGGKKEGFQPSEANHLHLLMDVNIDNPKGGESLVYDEESLKWVNKTVEGGEGGDASLSASITAGVKVGNINIGATLEKGLTFEEFVEMMFSEDVTKVPPMVKLTNLPPTSEVGETVKVNPSYSYTDGKFKNAQDENGTSNPNALCEAGTPTYYLDDSVISPNIELNPTVPKEYTLKISLPYSESKAKVLKKSGEEYTEKIPAGAATNEATFKVCYKWFVGCLTKAEVQSIDSAKVRALGDSGFNGFVDPTKSVATLISSTWNTEAGKWIVIALPPGYSLSYVEDSTFPGTSYHEEFDKQTCEVNCGGEVKAAYNIYIYKLSTTATSGMGISKIEIKK